MLETQIDRRRYKYAKRHTDRGTRLKQFGEIKRGRKREWKLAEPYDVINKKERNYRRNHQKTSTYHLLYLFNK